jgi:hypothetical protein
VIGPVSVDKPFLWPPNHQMDLVTVNYSSSDNCGATCALSATSNEPDSGLGDGDTPNDIQVVDATHIRLRAERSARGSGRISTIKVTCTDASGNTTMKTVTVQVQLDMRNPKSGADFRINLPIDFEGTFLDLPGKTHTAQWLFDNITITGTVTEPTGIRNGSVRGTYIFTEPGVYLVTMRLTDSSGATSSVSTVGDLDAIVVIYDPNGGYVTGGGWINSPAGAYPADPGQTGKGNFAFVSKYFRNATNPRGETQFDLTLGNFKFNALNFDYLVVSGARAQYKGFGKINGEAGYDFILTVIDGQAEGGGGVDKFRIKIWRKNTSAIVYDNQMGAPDNADPTNPVGNGSSIVIQP